MFIRNYCVRGGGVWGGGSLKGASYSNLISRSQIWVKIFFGGEVGWVSEPKDPPSYKQSLDPGLAIVCVPLRSCVRPSGFAGKEMSDLHRFSLETGEWTELHVAQDRGVPLLPRSVYAHATLRPSGHLVLIGGEVNPSDKGHEGAGSFARDVVVADVSGPGDAVVLHSADMPEGFEPRGWSCAAATADGKVVLFGGLAGDDAAPRRLDDTWVLSDFVTPNACSQ